MPLCKRAQVVQGRGCGLIKTSAWFISPFSYRRYLVASIYRRVHEKNSHSEKNKKDKDIDIKLLFKSLFVSEFSDIVASLLSDYKPDCRLRSTQNGSLFYLWEVRTKTFTSFYSNRVVSTWNILPKDLCQEQSLDGFVRKLNSFYYLKF